jgi:hypothetical protein
MKNIWLAGELLLEPTPSCSRHSKAIVLPRARPFSSPHTRIYDRWGGSYFRKRKNTHGSTIPASSAASRPPTLWPALVPPRSHLVHALRSDNLSGNRHESKKETMDKNGNWTLHCFRDQTTVVESISNAMQILSDDISRVTSIALGCWMGNYAFREYMLASLIRSTYRSIILSNT